MFRRILMASAALTVIATAPMTAQASDKITKAAVESMIKKSVEAQKKGSKETVKYLEKHAADDAQIKIKMITKIEGAPTQEQILDLTKSEVIEMTLQGGDAAKINDVESNILKLDIAEDGQTAKVKDIIYTEMVINVPTPQGEIAFDSSISMLCDDELAINGDVIQITKSDCSSETTMKPQK